MVHNIQNASTQFPDTYSRVSNPYQNSFSGMLNKLTMQNNVHHYTIPYTPVEFKDAVRVTFSHEAMELYKKSLMNNSINDN